MEATEGAAQVAETRRKVQELRRERDSLLRVIEAREKSIEKLRQQHEAEQAEKARRERRQAAVKAAYKGPTRPKARPKKQEKPAEPEVKEEAKTTKDYQLKTIELLEKQVTFAERNRDKLKETLALLQDEEYIQSLGESIAEKNQHIKDLITDIALMKQEIEQMDKDVDAAPEVFSPLPNVNKAEDKFQVMDLQSRLYINRREFLFAYMGELGKEFAFLSPMISDNMMAEDADNCMQAINEHMSNSTNKRRNINPQEEDNGGYIDDNILEGTSDLSGASANTSTESEEKKNNEEVAQDEQKQQNEEEKAKDEKSEENKQPEDLEQKEIPVENDLGEYSDANIEKSNNKDDENEENRNKEQGEEEEVIEPTRTDYAENLIRDIERLLKSFHDARKRYNFCLNLQSSLTEVYKNLLEQVRLYEGPLADTEGDYKLITKAQEELRRLAERSEAIRKYAEEYQKYSGEIMQIE